MPLTIGQLTTTHTLKNILDTLPDIEHALLEHLEDILEDADIGNKTRANIMTHMTEHIQPTIEAVLATEL